MPSKPPRQIIRVVLALALVLALPGAAAHADTLEASVKSAFLLNFARFADFAPAKFASPDAPLDICVLTPDPLEATLDDSLHGKTVKGHAVRVRRSDRPELLRDCQLVFIASRSGDLLDAQLAKLSGFGVLTVHEASAARGAGVVRLFVEDHHLRFEVNVAAAEREDIQMAAGLLEMAKRVRQ